MDPMPLFEDAWYTAKSPTTLQLAVRALLLDVSLPLVFYLCVCVCVCVFLFCFFLAFSLCLQGRVFKVLAPLGFLGFWGSLGSLAVVSVFLS